MGCSGADHQAVHSAPVLEEAGDGHVGVVSGSVIVILREVQERQLLTVSALKKVKL